MIPHTPNPYSSCHEAATKIEWDMFKDEPGYDKAIEVLSKRVYAAYELIRTTATDLDRLEVAKWLNPDGWAVTARFLLPPHQAPNP